MLFPFPPEWYLFIYLHFERAFELLGWQELGLSNGSSPRRRDSNRQPSDQQALGSVEGMGGSQEIQSNLDIWILYCFMLYVYIFENQF